MEWRRLVEGVIISVLFFAAIALFSDPGRTLARLESVRSLPVLGALAATLVGELLWSGVLSVLLRAQGYRPRLGRFQTIFVAGAGLRSIVPGGSVSGPAVVAYFVSRTTDVPGETSVAMAYVAEVFLWAGSAVVGTVGLVGLLVSHGPSPRLLEFAGALAVVTALAFGVVLYGVRRPAPIESRVDHVATVVHDFVAGHSSRLATEIDPDRVGVWLDRFFDAFRRLANDPRHLSPALVAAIGGWFVHATAFYRLSRPSASGLDPEGEGHTLR